MQLFFTNKLLNALIIPFCILSMGCSSSNSLLDLGAGRNTSDFNVKGDVKEGGFVPVKPERWSLANGLSVIYLRDDELPLVQGQLLIRGGSLWAERSPLGTTSAMGDTMRTGGAGALSSEALDRELERLAASISSSFSSEFGSISFSCLAGDLERVFPLFSDVALKPRFEQDKLSLWKGQSLEAIRRRVEDPSTVASIAFMQLVYGDSAYGRVSTSRDIKVISQEDLRALHSDLVRPDGAILVLTGALKREQAEALVGSYLSNWQARGRSLPPAPPVNYQPKPGIYFVTLPFAQASVKAGHLSVPRLTSDYPEIDLFNEIFGSGGFGSRLMKRVRTELGLSYGIYGGIAPAVVKGTNYVFLQTKGESVGLALAESLAELERLQREAPSESELEERRQAIANSYVFNFDSRGEVAGRLANQELLGYPPDYDSTYLNKIAQVKAEGISEVARKRWDVNGLVVVVVGNQEAYAALERDRREGKGVLGILGRYDLNRIGFDEVIRLSR
jgi:zinc protease